MRWMPLLLAVVACGKRDASPSGPPPRPVPELLGVRWTGDLELELELMLPTRDEGGGKFRGEHVLGASMPPPGGLAVWVRTSAKPGDRFFLKHSTHKVSASSPGRYALVVTHQYSDEEDHVDVADLVVDLPLAGQPEPAVLWLTSPAAGELRLRALVPGGETRSLTRGDTDIRRDARAVHWYLTAGLVRGQKLRLRATDMTLELEEAGRWTVIVHFATVDLESGDDLEAPAHDAFREIARKELVISE